MADPVTVNRGFAQPTRGSDVGTWDTPVNGNMSLLDTIVGGIVSIAVTTGVTTLNAAQLQCGTITVTGALVADATIAFPAVQGWWSIENLTAGSFTLFVQSGTGTQVICMPPAEITDIQVNGNVVKYRNLGRVGSYLDYSGSSVPAWITKCTIPPYLLCDGSAFSAGTYPNLAGILGTTLPDLRGRSRAYLNGGTNRITSAGSGINGDAVLSAGGSQSTTLTSTNQLPPYTPSGTVTVATPQINDRTPGSGGLGALAINMGSGSAATVVGIGSGSGTILVGPAPAATFAGSAVGSSAAIPSMNPVAISGITMIRAG